MTDDQPDQGTIERNLGRLATERATLYARAGSAAGLSKDEQARLHAIEREMDDCFKAVREIRAARDARRFTLEGPMRGRGIPRQPPRA